VKIGGFLLKLMLMFFEKKLTMTLGFEKNANFFPQKIGKNS
jgi:hypothetical protein